MVKPYPKDQLCPKCGTFIPEINFNYTTDDDDSNVNRIPREFETRENTVADKFGDKIKVKRDVVTPSGYQIELIGITSRDRTQLYCSNVNLKYLLELANNLDFIATSILGKKEEENTIGELDKMLLISENEGEKKCQFYVKEDLIYLIYGKFPDKQGKWFLEQMAKSYGELISGKDVNKLNKLEKNEIDRKFIAMLNGIKKEFKDLIENQVFSDQEIPYVEDQIRLDYLGLSSMSIGVISLLVGEELEIEAPGEYDDPEEEKEMKESGLTARIEAIAANTLGNTGAYPRWIAVKLGYQNYRFLTFKKYPNEYFLYMLLEGNLKKLDKVEEEFDRYIQHVVDSPFSGTLKPFNRLKATFKEMLLKKRVYK
jgi:hypothetical protein